MKLRIVVITSIVMLLSSCYVPRQESTPDTPDNQSTTMAYVMTQQLVTNQLKSPSSAKFPYSSDVSVKRDGVGWTIVGYVDSQNGFGAMIRTKYLAKVEYLGGDQWKLAEFYTTQ